MRGGQRKPSTAAPSVLPRISWASWASWVFLSARHISATCQPFALKRGMYMDKYATYRHPEFENTRMRTERERKRKVMPISGYTATILGRLWLTRSRSLAHLYHICLGSNLVQLFALLTRVHSPNFRRNRRDPIPHKIAQDAQDAQEIWESTDDVKHTERVTDVRTWMISRGTPRDPPKHGFPGDCGRVALRSVVVHARRRGNELDGEILTMAHRFSISPDVPVEGLFPR